MDSTAAQEYVFYKPKLAGDTEQFFHWDFMRVLMAFQAFLGEPTCHDIVRAYRKVERALLFRKH